MRRMTGVAAALLLLAGAVRAAPSVAEAPSRPPLADGYWLAGSDGGVFAFGDAPFFGHWGRWR